MHIRTQESFLENYCPYCPLSTSSSSRRYSSDMQRYKIFIKIPNFCTKTLVIF